MKYRVVVVVFVFVGLCISANAVTEGDLLDCSKIEDDEKRLACYDKLADQLKQDKEQEAEQESEKNYLEQLTGKTDTTIKAEIKAHNQKTLGEYGASLVKTGVDEDWKAYQELKKAKYKAYKDIVKNNIKTLGDYGWSLVKTGVDEDIEAQKALDDF
ncbi:MAG: hypothetical protein F4W92_01600 [Gammaproteobacteria bacterium]|nr:hypothetical protein [Gammaproteobacteria bacterium]